MSVFSHFFIPYVPETSKRGHPGDHHTQHSHHTQHMKHITCIAAILAAILLMAACHTRHVSDDEGFSIVGVWQLARIEGADGKTRTMDMGRYTRCKLYDADSTYYCAELMTDGEDVEIGPHEFGHYILNDSVYIENGRVTPFQIINDTTMTTVWAGELELWHKVKTMTETRKEEIRKSVRFFCCGPGKNERLLTYVLSTSERELQSSNQRLLFIIAILILLSLLMGLYFFQTWKSKRQLEHQLGELQKIRDLRPQPVTNAMKETETAFFRSEYYLSLRKKIESGGNFTPAEWEKLEKELRVVYPDFSTALYQMYNLSAIEYRVCLLTKVRTNPTEIAGVLKRTPSSISSIRSRLYHKVFNGEGGAKEWDEYIMSL